MDTKRKQQVVMVGDSLLQEMEPPTASLTWCLGGLLPVGHLHSRCLRKVAQTHQAL